MNSQTTPAHDPSQNNITRGIPEVGKRPRFAENFLLVFNTTNSNRKGDNASAISA
jgi:hypothetical protein